MRIQLAKMRLTKSLRIKRIQAVPTYRIVGRPTDRPICWLKVDSIRIQHNILNHINDFTLGATAVPNTSPRPCGTNVALFLESFLPRDERFARACRCSCCSTVSTRPQPHRC